nr:hypothetical protein [Tanacetum cinerariifolium]
MGLAEDSDERARAKHEELCSNLMFQLGKTGAYAEAYTVYNMLRYSKKPMCKSSLTVEARSDAHKKNTTC